MGALASYHLLIRNRSKFDGYGEYTFAKSKRSNCRSVIADLSLTLLCLSSEKGGYRGMFKDGNFEGLGKCATSQHECFTLELTVACVAGSQGNLPRWLVLRRFVNPSSRWPFIAFAGSFVQGRRFYHGKMTYKNGSSVCRISLAVFQLFAWCCSVHGAVGARQENGPRPHAVPRRISVPALHGRRAERIAMSPLLQV